MEVPAKAAFLIDLFLANQNISKSAREQLSANPGISLKDIEKNSSLPWDWWEIAKRPDITLLFIKKHRTQLSEHAHPLRWNRAIREEDKQGEEWDWIRRKGDYSFEHCILHPGDFDFYGGKLSPSIAAWALRSRYAIHHLGKRIADALPLKTVLKIFPMPYSSEALPFRPTRISRSLIEGFGDQWWQLLDDNQRNVPFHLIEKNFDELSSEGNKALLDSLLFSCNDVPLDFLIAHPNLFSNMEYMEWEAVYPEEAVKHGFPLSSFAGSPNLLFEHIDETFDECSLSRNPFTRQHKRARAARRIERWWLRVGIYDLSYPAAMRHARRQLQGILA